LWALVALATASAATVDGAEAAQRKRAAPKGPECPVAGTRLAAFGKALDGASFATKDGAIVRLSGVLAPGQGGESLRPGQGDAAKQALASALRGGAVSLVEEGPHDRYGRMVAQVFAGGVWVQGALLKAGQLRAAPDRVSTPCAQRLLAAEDEARVARAGFWRDGTYAVRTPNQLGKDIGTFQTVEGTVVTASTNKGRAYINFGADYRTDFTATVAPTDMKSFRTARLDVKSLAGKRIRVRGWLEQYNGPEMEIADPAAIERLDEPVVAAAPPRAEHRKDASQTTRKKRKRRTA